VALVDVKMPAMTGLELTRRLYADGWPVTVIVMSAYGDDELAIEAVRAGAYDYIAKPFRPAEVLLLLRKAEEREQLRRENRTLKQQLGGAAGLGGETGIVFASESMGRVLAQLRKVAEFPTTVLVTGESGTGKELMARALHTLSGRAGQFVAVNCAAIPEALLESELFGHVKGAFTDAQRDKQGLFEQAHKGTLFLDELTEMPLTVQAKLLRALQLGEVRRVGDTRSLVLDTRVVAATNRDIEEMVKAGRFREDLYYRVAVVPIRIPSLRERPTDIAPLVRHFIAEFNRRLGLEIEGVGPQAMRKLMRHPWPGNVRELENTLQRAMVMTDGPLIGETMFDSLWSGRGDITTDLTPGEDLSIKRASDRLERALIREALTRTGGNRTRAAELLDISLRALMYKIKDYGIDDL
jgi:two-component system response regulator AtoC